MAKFSDPVKAYPLDGSGPKVGFFVEADVDADHHDKIQVGGDFHALAYREPPYDDDGPNGTYAKV